MPSSRYDQATSVTAGADGSYSHTFAFRDYDAVETRPPGITVSNTNQNAAWFTWTQQGSRTVKFEVSNNDGRQVAFDLVSYVGGTYTLVASAPLTAYQTVLTTSATDGVVYYLRVSSIAAYASDMFLVLVNLAPNTVHNHNWYNATNYTAPFSVDQVCGNRYTDPEDTSVLNAYTNGSRAAWFTFVAGTASPVQFSGYGTAGGDPQIDFYRQDSSTALTRLGTGGSLNYTTPALVVGTRYYLRVTSTSSFFFSFHLDGTGSALSPAAVVPLSMPAAIISVSSAGQASSPTLALPPATIAVSGYGLLAGQIEIANVTPATVTVRSPAPVVVENLAPTIAAVSSPIPMLVDAGLVLTQPEDDETVITYRPTFIVGLQQRDESLKFTIEIQYDDDPAFLSPTTINQTVDSAAGGLIVTPTSDVPTHTYWRARLLLDGVEQIPWTASREFTVDVSVTPVALPVTWNVDPGAARPIHLWHFNPPGPLAGETVTAYGQGFPLTPGRILFNDDLLVIGTWSLVAADASIVGVIDGDTVGPEHFEVTFAAPGAPPGGPITVEA